MKLIRIGLIILSLILVFFFVYDGTFSKKTYIGSTEDYDTDMEKILVGAMLASSGHNMQPWLIKIEGSHVDLYADMEKQLPVIDGYNQQLLMSQGTFIEKFIETANDFGYFVHLKYGDMNLADKHPYIIGMDIERVSKSSTVDTISSATNRYSDSDVDLETQVQGVNDEFHTLDVHVIEKTSEIVSLLRHAYRIEAENKEATLELIENFRFTERDKNEFRYGLSLDLSPAIKPFLQPILKMTSSDWEGFGQAGIKVFDQRLNEETFYILLTSNDQSELTYVEAGRYYQRLKNEVEGYELRPAVQILEDLEGIEALNNRFHELYSPEEEIVLIIGVKPAASNNKKAMRHQLEDILLEEGE